jgi:RimJ/RimL family protein N-acetyltransferase
MQLQPIPLRGTLIDMVPLSEAHSESLLKNTPRDAFTYFRYEDPEWTLDGIRRFIRDAIAMPDRVPFATVLKSTGEAIGSSSYCEIRLPNKGIEVGFTWIAKEHRGTRVNPESKLLMFTHAFEVLGCERAQLKCDALNLHSAAAILKLGAKKEGVLRKQMLVRGGRMRDTAIFSIIREEWPAVKAGLEKRVAQ